MTTKYTFEWDVLKELQNIKKHGCLFAEAIEVFADPHVIHLEDEKHSGTEDRFYAVGGTLRGKILTVRYTARGKVIRIFGAGEWRKWKKFYEKNTRSKSDEKD